MAKTLTNVDAHFDVCIIGGGPVGLAVAAGLPAYLKVVLVEPNAAALQATTTFDGRTIALAHQGIALFKRLGIWPRLAKDSSPIRHIRIADQGSPLKLDFNAREVGHDAFGAMVENRHLRAALFDAVRKRKNVTVLCPASVAGFSVSGNMAQVQLADGRAFKTALIIAADGRTSPARQRTGTTSFAFTYAQQAITCTVEHSAPHNDVALEHFLPEGPFAALPLTNNRSGIVWTVKPDTAKALMALNDDDFIALMANAGAGFLGTMTMHTPRATYPLALQHAHAYTAPHFLLIGDAAHTMHPIAGQGFNMGLRDVDCLLNLVDATLARGLRIDDGSLLQQYETQRRRDNQAMLAATDVIDRLFSNTLPLITPLRKVGLGLVDKIGPLRRFFMQQAMGLGAVARSAEHTSSVKSKGLKSGPKTAA